MTLIEQSHSINKIKISRISRRLLLAVFLIICPCVSSANQEAVDSSVSIAAQTQQAQFGELVYHYFQQDYEQVLTLTQVRMQDHEFASLSQDDRDRVMLMQGASQLQLGLFTQSQQNFTALLNRTTSDYVQANTWFFLAKASFENKQQDVSEQAYQSVKNGQLDEYLSAEQWHELLYLTAFSRMQKDQNWLEIAQQIPQEDVFTSYLLANQATKFFNTGRYDLAVENFIRAKQALQAYKNRQGFVTKLATDLFDSVSWYMRPWTWFDDNAIAQEAMKEREEGQEEAEVNALFDLLNIGLGQSLLQQNDYKNALAVISNISSSGAETEQALLAYGWANARENRWQEAMSAWQYLQTNGVGLSSLQASYGLAYAYGQQDNLGQAFFALQTTSSQIINSIQTLDEFEKAVNKRAFFDQYGDKWPVLLSDLRIDFFSPSSNFDAKYLLEMRRQAQEVLRDIENKRSRIEQLDLMLAERINSYLSRQQSVSLADSAQLLSQARSNIESLSQLLTLSDSFEDQLVLSKRMASLEEFNLLKRLERAQARHQRLINSPDQKRPVKASYAERLSTLEGILTWRLMDDLVAQKWQHQQLIRLAKNEWSKAQQQLSRLEQISQSQDAFKNQRQSLLDMNAALKVEQENAIGIFDNATAILQKGLIELIQERRQQLKKQEINTRLAMIRIQDLSQQRVR